MDSMKHQILALLFITNFILILGFSLVFPLLPFYAREFGASTFEIALVISAFPLMQFLFSPVWGKISDVIGRKPIILFSLAGSTISFVLFGMAGSLFQLVLLRILHGISSSAGLPAVFAAGADISTNKQRAAVMGTLGAAFSLAIVFGPAIGGILSSVSIQFPFFVSAAVALINLIFVYLIVPETNLNKRKKLDLSNSLILTRIVPALRSKLAPIYSIQFISFLSFAIVGVAFPLFALKRFGFGPVEVGYTFAFLGLAGAITQGFIMGKAVEKYGEVLVIRVGLIFMAVSLFLIAFTPLPALIALVLAIMSVGTSLINPSNNSYISKQAGKQQGFALGILNSFGSLSRFIGPLVVGLLFGKFGAEVVFLLAASVAFLGILISYRIPQ